MVNADRQVIIVHFPQTLEDELGQKPRIGEHQRGAVGFDCLVQLRHRPAPGVTAPRHALLNRQQDFNLGIGARLAQHQIGCRDFTSVTGALRSEPFLKIARIGERC